MDGPLFNYFYKIGTKTLRGETIGGIEKNPLRFLTLKDRKSDS